MMRDAKAEARKLLVGFKGTDYTFGFGCFDRTGWLTAQVGRKAAVIAGGTGKGWGDELRGRLATSLASAGVEIIGGFIPGARPNSPREDVFRIADELAVRNPEVVVAAGGGSVIDAAKAALAWWRLGDRQPDIESYFGVGKVSAMLAADCLSLPPLVAVQVASGSAAHLTRYCNITDTGTWQKKLIVEDVLTPKKAVYDYSLSVTMSRSFTADGALDGLSHALEVFYGAKGDALQKTRPAALLAVELIVDNLNAACADGTDLAAREALGLATDLGGCLIMVGSTNGPHLTSFSLTDVLPHGRACGLMTPYYTVFFAPAIESQLRDLARIFKRAGLLKRDTASLTGRNLALALSEAMIELLRSVGCPTRLSDVPGFDHAHIRRALTAAKDPQLEMKLRNMPVPLNVEQVDEYIGAVLEAARTGDFTLIRDLPPE